MAQANETDAPGFHANDFGLLAGLAGFAVGIILSTIAVSSFAEATHHLAHPSNFGSEVASLFGLWCGLIGAALGCSIAKARRAGKTFSLANLTEDYGLRLRPWPDLPLGIAAGVASQFLLVPALEALLVPFVPHVFSRLSQPAQRETSGVHGFGVVVLVVLLCVATPIVEELFFRGLLLRGFAGKTAALGPRWCAVVSIGLSALCFGLAHFEALQLISLVGFGVVLASLAWRTGRLGPGMVAHAAFNAVTVLALVH
jgi:membrane protease YdiL (CAAX protease family)